MPEINNALAAAIKVPDSNDMMKWLSTASTLQQSQAHAGLYALQQQDMARKQEAYRQYRETGDVGAVAAYDPAAAKTLLEYQKDNLLLEAGKRYAAGDKHAFDQFPDQTAHLASAESSTASANKTNLEAGRTRDEYGLLDQRAKDSGNLLDAFPKVREAIAAAYEKEGDAALKRFDIAGRAGNMALADPSPAGWGRAVDVARAGGLINDMDAEAAKSKGFDRGMAMQFAAAGMASKEYATASGMQAGEEAKAKAPYTPFLVPPQNSVFTNEQVAKAGAAANAQLSQPPNGGPNTRAAGGVQPAVTGLMPETIKRQDDLAKMPGDLADRASNAVAFNFLVGQMRHESTNFRMGKWATGEYQVRNMMSPFIEAFGSPALKESWSKPIASFQAFSKFSMQGVMEAVKSVSSRAAVQEFQMIQGTQPNPDMQRGGFEKIGTHIEAINDFSIAEHQAAGKWRAEHNGSMDGFMEEWHKNVTPTAFLIRRMTPEMRQELADNMQKTAKGRGYMETFKKRFDYARDNGLFEGLD